MDNLKNLQIEIEKNRTEKQSHCKECPLNDDYKYTGPVFFDSEGDNPTILIISEGPAGFDQVDCNPSKVQEWKEMILNDKNKKTENENFSKYTQKMQDFLPLLTNNEILGRTPGKTSKYFYWTHTLKCFIQNYSNKSIRDAKKKFNDKYHEMCQNCGKYINKEIRCFDPKLIIALGKETKENIPDDIKKEKHIIYLPHPASLGHQQDENKIKNILSEYEKARKKVMEVLIMKNINYFIGLATKNETIDYCKKEHIFLDLWKYAADKYKDVKAGDIGFLYSNRWDKDKIIGIYEALGGPEKVDHQNKILSRFDLKIKVKPLKECNINDASKIFQKYGIKINGEYKYKLIPEPRFFNEEVGKNIEKEIHEIQSKPEIPREKKIPGIPEDLLELLKNIHSEYLRKTLEDKLIVYEEYSEDLFARSRCPEMVNHGIRHIHNLLRIFNNFLVNYNDKLEKRLNDYEIFFLIISIYLHDIGMQGYKDIEECLEVRKEHGKLTADILKHTVKNRKYFSDLMLKKKDESGIILICKYHQSGTILEDLNDKSLEKDGEKIRIKLLAAILSIIDQCDISCKRSGEADIINSKKEECEEQINEIKEIIKKGKDEKNKKYLEYLEYLESQSEHYKMHSEIEDIRFSNDNIIIKPYPSSEEEEILGKAEDYIRKELERSGPVLKEYGINITGVKIE